MPDQKAIVNVDKLNIRAGPGTEFQVVGQLARGLVVLVQRIEGEWAELDLRSLEGYVLRAHIAFNDPASVASGATGLGIIDAERVNVRSGPGTSFETIAVGSKGDLVEIIAYEADWHSVRTKPLSGFVMRHFVVPVIAGTPEIEGPYRAFINEALVNLRSGPGEQFAVIGRLPKATEVMVQRLTDGWAEISTIPLAGFVRADLVKIVTQDQASASRSTSNPFATVTADWLRLRKGSGEESTVLAYLPAGNQLEVLDIALDWIRVRPIIRPAFVAQNYLEPVADEIPAIAPAFGDPLKPPEHQIIPISDTFSPEQRIMASNWNEYGGVIQQISAKFSLDPVVALAVLSVESQGKGFGADGRLLIRFENHYFYRYWGVAYEGLYHRHFRFHPEQSWQGHQYRRSASAKWLDVHTGDQRSEWDAFEFAKQFDRIAAFQSISMGSPQIMGANYALIGFASPEEMFYAFQSDFRQHVWSMFRYIERRNIMAELISENFKMFAEAYNGPSQASVYGEKLKRYVEQFRKIQPRLV